MGFGVLPIPTSIHLHVLIGVNWQGRIRIDRDKEESRVSLSRVNDGKVNYKHAAHIYKVCLVSHV